MLCFSLCFWSMLCFYLHLLCFYLHLLCFCLCFFVKALFLLVFLANALFLLVFLVDALFFMFILSKIERFISCFPVMGCLINPKDRYFYIFFMNFSQQSISRTSLFNMFFNSSGTSGGERKLMPTIEEELDRRSFLYSFLMPVMSQFVPGLDKGKGMYFLFIKSESKTPGGLPARPVLTSYYKSSHFKERPFDPYTNYTSPNETILCSDSYQSMYSQMLCGLCQHHEVLRVGAVFASGFIRAIKFLEKHWTELVRDIRTGTLSSSITDPSVREAVAKILKPSPKLAEFVESECKKKSWQGIITRLWPNTKYVDVIVTGTMSQYIPTLDYYSSGLPLVCTMYASSECYFGVNLRPLCKPSEVSYTLIPTMAYFEFCLFIETQVLLTPSIYLRHSLKKSNKSLLI